MMCVSNLGGEGAGAARAIHTFDVLTCKSIRSVVAFFVSTDLQLTCPLLNGGTLFTGVRWCPKREVQVECGLLLCVFFSNFKQRVQN